MVWWMDRIEIGPRQQISPRLFFLVFLEQEKGVSVRIGKPLTVPSAVWASSSSSSHHDGHDMLPADVGVHVDMVYPPTIDTVQWNTTPCTCALMIRSLLTMPHALSDSRGRPWGNWNN